MNQFFHTTLIVERTVDRDDFEKEKTFVKTVTYCINKEFVASAFAPISGPGTIVRLVDGKEVRIDENFEDFFYFLRSEANSCCVADLLADACDLKAGSHV